MNTDCAKRFNEGDLIFKKCSTFVITKRIQNEIVSTMSVKLTESRIIQYILKHFTNFHETSYALHVKR